VGDPRERGDQAGRDGAERAEILELTYCGALDALAAARTGHRGAGRLRCALREHDVGTTLTRSELEERFLALCRAHDLPQPRVNARVAGLEVDFLFKPEGLVVETDGWRYHRTRQAFERDRRRDAALTRAGYRTLRFTHRQVTADVRSVAQTVAAALAHRVAA
jgi:very-short-patch-repair endonuclease